MVTVGGKTGTAQVVALEARGKNDNREDHAWFAGFAPAEKPEIVIVALVENGGHGGVTAAPVVKEVMQAYFLKKQELLAVAAERRA
jgi:penicillin-binding protein 2